MEDIKNNIKDWHKIIEIFTQRIESLNYNSSQLQEDVTSLISILLLHTGEYTSNNRERLRKTFSSIMYMEDVSIENQLASLKQKIEKLIDEQQN